MYKYNMRIPNKQLREYARADQEKPLPVRVLKGCGMGVEIPSAIFAIRVVLYNMEMLYIVTILFHPSTTRIFAGRNKRKHCARCRW